MRAVLVLLLSCLTLISGDEVQSEESKKTAFIFPRTPANAYLALYFDKPSDLINTTHPSSCVYDCALVLSNAKKEGADESVAKYDGKWSVEEEETSALSGDYSLVLKSRAKHHAIAIKLDRPLKFDVNEVVIQYEVKFARGMDCGGAYIKLLSDLPDLDLHNISDKTPYTTMFGPDKCGSDHKLHFIIRHKNPITQEFEEKHAKRVTADIDRYFVDKKTHLYRLVLRRDNTFEELIDRVVVQKGNLLTDMEPSINPPAEIDDPNDKRPEDWDEREMIVDATAKKPDDWNEDEPEFITEETATMPPDWLEDEPELIPDPNAVMPQDWDEETDGEWEAPLVKNERCKDAPGCGKWHKPQIKNPNYKGKWSPPMVPNPAFKGHWKPAKIPNPNYYNDDKPFEGLTPVKAIALELWSMTNEVIFDNFLVVDSVAAADQFTADTWDLKSNAERIADPKAHSVVDAVRETYKEKPLLVVGIGFACAIPILLCLWYMCRSPADPVAMRKKTDSSNADEQPTQYDSTGPNLARKPETSSDNESGDEDEDEEQHEASDSSPNVAAGDVSKEKSVSPGKEDSDLDATTELQSLETGQPNKSNVRKRRPRKE